MLNRGRLERKIKIISMRELTRDDLACLKEKRTTPVVARLRDPHHRVARLLAAGLRPAQVAVETGFSLTRIYTLQADPTFLNLVAEKRALVDNAYIDGEAERYSLAQEVNLKALRTIAEHFDKADEEGELIPLGRALSVFSDTADRTGLVKKSVSTNINVDYAKRLEQIRNRQKSLASHLPIEGEFTEVQGNVVRKV